MKKAVFFLPAAVFVLFYGLIALLMGLFPGAAVYIWIVLFVISGILLSRGNLWGSLIGLLPGIHLICMSMIDTGQIMEIELPAGMAVTAFYLLCGLFLLLRKKKR